MEQLELILSLIEGTNDLIHSIEPDGSFEFVNRAWLETLGYSEEDLKDISLKNILFPGHVKAHQDLISKVLKGEIRTNVEVILVTKSGDTRVMEGNLFPRKQNGHIVAATAFFRDITERKKTEEELAESKARNEFLVDLMVHDLMNINQEILSMLEILLMGPDTPPEQKGLIQEGLTELERASNLVSNVRKITQIYAKTPMTRLIDLYEVIASAARSADEAFPDKQLKLSTNLSFGQYSVMADRFLEDVFFSLFHNSMKFDKNQEVKIDVEAETIMHTPYLRLQIKDYGPGIADDEKERVFDKISHRRESIMGLGLGLTLVKTVLDSYGAYIRVEDRVENDYSKGANFVILIRHVQNTKMDAEEVQ